METIGVIIVDDHPLFREGVRNILESEEDMKVLAEATTGDQALQMVRELRPRVALIDVNLPNMNGIQATRQIMAERLNASVVLLTAYDDVEQVLHAFRLLEGPLMNLDSNKNSKKPLACSVGTTGWLAIGPITCSQAQRGLFLGSC